MTATCRGRLAQGRPGERPCTFPATRPTGLCGIHDNAERRRLANHPRPLRDDDYTPTALDRDAAQADPEEAEP